MNIVISVAAHMPSRRLPGKVLKDLVPGKPVLAFLVERLWSVKDAKVVVATTNEEADAPIARLAREMEVDFLASPLRPISNLLQRHWQAMCVFDADAMVLVGADDPFLEPKVMEAVIEELKGGKADYVKTSGWPLGMNAWGWTRAAMQAAMSEAKEPEELEHVVPFWEWRKGRFRHSVIQRQGEDLYDQLRLTLDTAADLEFLAKVAQEIHPTNRHFGLQDILVCLAEKPELLHTIENSPRGTAARKAIYDIERTVE